MVYLYGDKLSSIVEIDDGKILAKSLERNVLLILKDWEIIKEVEVKAEYQLTRSLLMPNFTLEHLPFVIHLGEYSYELVNILTNVVSPLCHVSAKNDVRQNAIFFSEIGFNRFSFNFCSIKKNALRHQVHTWHSLGFNQDALDLMKRYS